MIKLIISGSPESPRTSQPYGLTEASNFPITPIGMSLKGGRSSKFQSDLKLKLKECGGERGGGRGEGWRVEEGKLGKGGGGRR